MSDSSLMLKLSATKMALGSACRQNTVTVGTDGSVVCLCGTGFWRFGSSRRIDDSNNEKRNHKQEDNCKYNNHHLKHTKGEVHNFLGFVFYLFAFFH